MSISNVVEEAWGMGCLFQCSGRGVRYGMSISNAVEEAWGMGCLFPMQWKRPEVWDVCFQCNGRGLRYGMSFQCSGRGLRYGMSISNAVEEAWGMGCLFPMQWKRPEVWDVYIQCSGRGPWCGMSAMQWKRPMVWGCLKKNKTETRMTATVLSANVLPILHLPCLLPFLCHFHITNTHYIVTITRHCCANILLASTEHNKKREVISQVI